MKRQRDCAGCGAAVGIIGRDYCCRCWHRQQAEAAKGCCPDCGLGRLLAGRDGPVQDMLAGLRRLRRPGPAAGPGPLHPLSSPARSGNRPRGRARAAASPDTCASGTGWCGSCSRPGPPKDPPRICAGCGELRRHCGSGLCGRCWQTDPQRPFVAASSLAARLDDPPSWLGDFAGCAAAGFGPSRAAGLISRLGRLLEDGGSQRPQALLDRSRLLGRGRSPGTLARTLETFFVTRGLALPTGPGARLAAGRRQRRLDAVPGPLRPAVGGVRRRRA